MHDEPAGALSAFRLHGRTALVTGGAGLLGPEFVRTLAEAGARVYATDVDEQRLGSVADTLSPLGDRVQVRVMDVTSPESVGVTVREIVEADGRLDVLVNCAALNPTFDPSRRSDHAGDFETLPLERWNHALAVNLTGAMLCCQAAVPGMRSQNGGSIINLCSTYGLVGPDQRLYEVEHDTRPYKPADYSATKAGLVGLTRYLAAYLAGTAVRVNCLTPGGVFADHDDEFVRRYSSRTVLGRMARRDEMNGALLFLASDASSYMTGANLVVDGGWTAW
jgi:2-deoxy-D-gluconate 3-dehydrogenase